MEINQHYQLPVKKTTINVIWDKGVDYVLMIQKRRNMKGFGDQVGKVGKDKFNFTGGKVDTINGVEETFLEGVTRETMEETGLKIIQTMPKGFLNFAWPQINIQNMVFLTTEWEGEPIEGTEEARVLWVPRSKIPFNKMFNTDRVWVPEAFKQSFFYHHIDGKMNGNDIENTIDLSLKYKDVSSFKKSLIGRQFFRTK